MNCDPYQQQNLLPLTGSFQGADDVDLLSLGPADPVGEVDDVGHGGAQHDDVHVVRKQDQDFLPHDAALGIVDVVHLEMGKLLCRR